MPPIPTPQTGAQCPRCGSPWFAQQEFRRYADLYSSRVGGSLSQLPCDPQYALVCLCGMLIPPKSYYPRGYQVRRKSRVFSTHVKGRKNISYGRARPRSVPKAVAGGGESGKYPAAVGAPGLR